MVFFLFWHCCGKQYMVIVGRFESHPLVSIAGTPISSN